METQAGYPAGVDQDGASVMDPVLRRMATLATIGPEQRRLVEGLGRRVETIAPRQVLQTEGEVAGRARYILSGWACRQRLLPDGRRQIFGLLLAGDGIGLCLHARPLARTTTVALTRLTAVDAGELVSATQSQSCPDCAEALNLAAAMDEAMLLNQVVRLGRQTAYERVAHLLLELNARLEAVGLASDGRFELPLTQEVLADVLGLSIVHINRTLQQLRHERLVSFAAGKVHLLEPALLVAAANYVGASLVSAAPPA